jgi:UDPglucose 6-dehydrogenase
MEMMEMAVSNSTIFSVPEVTTVSVVGLGKLGQPLAVCLALRGFDVIAVDTDEAIVTSLRQGKVTIRENNLQNTLDAASGKLTATTKHADAIQGSDVTFILVPTPSDRDGNFSNLYLETAVVSLATALRHSDKPHHTFIINSTVMPGTVHGTLIPLIEKHSGRELGQGFGICYCPEMVALGAVVDNLLYPDFVVIGVDDSHISAGIAEFVYRRLCSRDPPILDMSLVNAELFKITLNCYLTTKISFANTLANLCEQIPGADVDVITNALGYDTRINSRYLRGGLAYGGYCFPRDLDAMQAVCHTHQVGDDLPKTINYINKLQKFHLLNIVLSILGDAHTDRVSILGLSFKPGTHNTEASPALELVRSLVARDVHVTVYDPAAMDDAHQHLGDTVEYTGTMHECIHDASVVVITTAWDEFSDLE